MKRDKVIEVFANEIAEGQRKADKFYYINKDVEMSSFVLDMVLAIKQLAIKLGICEEVYNRAYEIYYFRNSGKEGYTLSNGKIVKKDEIK